MLRERRDSARALIEFYNTHAAVQGGEIVANLDSAESRWRAVYLMGRLGDPGVKAHLHAVASQPLPDYKAMPRDLADAEYLVQLRALGALREIGALKELQELHAQGGDIGKMAAVELFAAGVPPKGYRELDRTKLMAVEPPSPMDRSTGQSPGTELRHTHEEER